LPGHELNARLPNVDCSGEVGETGGGISESAMKFNEASCASISSRPPVDSTRDGSVVASTTTGFGFGGMSKVETLSMESAVCDGVLMGWSEAVVNESVLAATDLGREVEDVEFVVVVVFVFCGLESLLLEDEEGEDEDFDFRLRLSEDEEYEEDAAVCGFVFVRALF
jgi:hypothetical protein